MNSFDLNLSIDKSGRSLASFGHVADTNVLASTDSKAKPLRAFCLYRTLWVGSMFLIPFSSLLPAFNCDVAICPT